MANTDYCAEHLDEAAMLQLAARLAAVLPKRLVMYMNGTLGAGKTTFSRGLIQALGHSGAVKSPTYTLVEPYSHLNPSVYHFDSYRLAEPEELEYIGIRDYSDQDALFIIEWPQCGQGHLPEADIELTLTINNDQSRSLLFHANSTAGQHLLQQIA